jgi:excisionase family DNA binding protein
MKVRKLKHKRRGVTHLSSDEAARVLNMSRACFNRLVRTGELSAIRHAPGGGRRWFSAAQLLAYKKRLRVLQRDGLTRMMNATDQDDERDAAHGTLRRGGVEISWHGTSPNSSVRHLLWRKTNNLKYQDQSVASRGSMFEIGSSC